MYTPAAIDLSNELVSLSDRKTAKILQSFFKTAPGQYGAGDVFLGIRVPRIRNLVKKYKNLSLEEVSDLLDSRFHEQRLFVLLWMVSKYRRSAPAVKGRIFCNYLERIAFVNNWDLVDLTAPHIVGDYLFRRDKKILYDLACSPVVWPRRIAVVATFYFIRKNYFTDTFKLARIFLRDEHDLIHKAVGWMLREVGKRDYAAAEKFLRNYYKRMPRVMLRYAIERLPPQARHRYLKGEV